MKRSGVILMFLICLLPVRIEGTESIDPESVIARMEEAYKKVNDYRTNLEVRTYAANGPAEIKLIRYTFKKPCSIQLDFEKPDSGMVVVYPDREGKVAVRPLSWLPFVVLHKSVNDPQMEVSPGQRINQTDLGLLIQNIGHSVNGQRKGPVTTTSDRQNIIISVLADNHFQKNVITHYTFYIDKKLWLPVKVEEKTPDGKLERTVIFHDLKVNIGVPDSFFHLD